MKNEYKITKKEMLSWAKEYPLVGAVNILLFILWGIVGTIGLLMILLFSFVGGGEPTTWFFSVFFIFLSVYKLFFSRYFAIANRYNSLSKTYGVSEWTRTVEFADAEIILSDHTSVTKFTYKNIKKIKEKNNVILIFFNNNIALPLYKDAFTNGSWEECKKKIGTMLK